jgi:hypothetical protein
VTTKKATTSTGDTEVTRIVSLTALADQVEELTKRIVSGGGKAPGVSRETPAGTGGGSLDDQVTRAVEQAREKERQQSEAEARQKAIDDRIKGLEERTEKRPVERSKLSRWLWGDE